MGIFDFIKKLTNKTSMPPTQKPYIINGKAYNRLIYDDVYEWADEPIDGTNLVISDLIFLWVIDRLGNNFDKYPIHLSRNYGVKSPELRIGKLIELSLATSNYTVTELGKKTIDQNKNIIELHKKGWVSEEDADHNLENHKSWKVEYIKYLEKIGDFDNANQVKQTMLAEEKQRKLDKIFSDGERLSKEKKYSESNLLLIPLSNNTNFNATAPLFERIAKNYRGLKEYDKEIEICTKFLKEKQHQYGGDMWKDVFNKRIDYARKKLK